MSVEKKPYAQENSSRKSNASSVLANVSGYGKATTSTTNIAAGVYLGSVSSTDQRHEIIPTISPPIIDHILDELKFKLFGSKSIPYIYNNPVITPSFSHLQTPSSITSRKGISTNKHDGTGFTANTSNNATTCAIDSSTYDFRLLIAEETCQMACVNNYKISLDYTHSKNSSIEQIRQNELKQYIFGSPIRSSDSSIQNDKVRTIPNSNFLLITRIFYLNSISNRLAITLCVSKFLLPVISEMWSQISYSLNEIQNVVLSMILKRNTGDTENEDESINDGLLPTNLDSNLEFAKEIDFIIQLLNTKVMPCLRSVTEIPRLFLYPRTFNEFVESWFKDVFSWIEIKDGPKLGFLPILLSKIVCCYKDSIADSRTTRIVVLSGNMVVANKLLFIIGGLLEPKYRGIISSHDNTNNDELKDLEMHLSSMTTRTPSRVSTPTLTSSETRTDKEFPNVQPTNHTLITNNPSQRLVNIMEITDTDDDDKIDSNLIPTVTHKAKPITAPRRGWTIPTQRNTYSSVSLSSNDSSLGEVIQPSSLKSSESSLHYLSSSLSSHPGSYGSWFNKRPSLSQFMPQSPSAKTNDSNERVPTLQRVTSNTSLHQYNVIPPSPVQAPTLRGTTLTPQPSPSISEYDEYPWFGTSSDSLRTDLNTMNSSTTNNNYVGFGNNNTMTNISNRKINSHGFPLKDVEIQRDCQRISQKEIVDNAFNNICLSGRKEEHKIDPADSYHAAVLDVDVDESMYPAKSMELMSRYTTYLPHFNPWFRLQAIPIAVDSENKVLNSMKKDLQVDNEIARSLIISLRTREIKEVFMKKDIYKGGMARNKHPYCLKQKTKKVFSGGKIGALSAEMEDCITLVELSIKKAMSLYEDNELSIAERDRQVLCIYSSILQYTEEICKDE